MFKNLGIRILAFFASFDPDVRLAARPIKGDYCPGCCRCEHCNGIEAQMVARKRALKRYGEHYCDIVRAVQTRAEARDAAKEAKVQA